MSPKTTPSAPSASAPRPTLARWFTRARAARGARGRSACVVTARFAGPAGGGSSPGHVTGHRVAARQPGARAAVPGHRLGTEAPGGHHKADHAPDGDRGKV